MRLIKFKPVMRSLAVLVAFLASAPSLFAHYSPVIDTSLSYDAPTLQLISQRAAANQPLIQAGDTLGVVLKATPYGGTIDGVGGYMTFYVPPGMQVVGAQYVRTAGTTNDTYYPINMKGQAAIAVGGLDAVDIPELAGLGLGPNLLGISNAVVNSSGLELGTISGVYGDTGIFYSTDPKTSFGSWTNSGGYYKDSTRTNGYVLTTDFGLKIIPVTEWDGEQEVGYGMISPATALICYPNSSHCMPWGLANDVAGPQSGYAWQFNWQTYSNVIQATGNRSLAMKSSVTNIGPWQRIQYPGSQISKDIPGNPSTALGYVGIDASTVGYNLNAAPLPATTSWTDTTSTKAVRFSLGALYLGKPE